MLSRSWRGVVMLEANGVDMATAIDVMARLERMADELDAAGLGVVVRVTIHTDITIEPKPIGA